MAISGAGLAVPPAAGYLLYKAYKDGTFGDIKEKIFAHREELSTEASTVAPEARPQIDGTTTLGNAFPGGTTIEIEQADNVHGQNAENVIFDPSVYQFYDDTCAIQSQRLILQQYGIDVPQEQLIEIAKENGWYAEGYGTPLDMVGKLLEYHGVEIHGSQGNNIFNLSNELAKGHQVIVGVDEFELVDPNDTRGWDSLNGQTPNHALVVVGIDTSDPDNVMVIVTDPGTGNRQMAYPADQFMDAWKDSDCFMVTTETVPPQPMWEYSPIDSFAGIPMADLDRLSAMEIDTTSSAVYDNFVDDLLADPLSMDDLMAQYADLFDTPDDDDFTDMMPC